jgi:hypothetical protein
MVVLCGDPSYGRFTQSGILFERFMEDFHRPSFLMIARNQFPLLY